jgi:hypothetical protein
MVFLLYLVWAIFGGPSSANERDHEKNEEGGDAHDGGEEADLAAAHRHVNRGGGLIQLHSNTKFTTRYKSLLWG